MPAAIGAHQKVNHYNPALGPDADAPRGSDNPDSLYYASNPPQGINPGDPNKIAKLNQFIFLAGFFQKVLTSGEGGNGGDPKGSPRNLTPPLAQGALGQGEFRQLMQDGAVVVQGRAEPPPNGFKNHQPKQDSLDPNADKQRALAAKFLRGSQLNFTPLGGDHTEGTKHTEPQFNALKDAPPAYDTQLQSDNSQQTDNQNPFVAYLALINASLLLIAKGVNDMQDVRAKQNAEVLSKGRSVAYDEYWKTNSEAIGTIVGGAVGLFAGLGLMAHDLKNSRKPKGPGEEGPLNKKSKVGEEDENTLKSAVKQQSKDTEKEITEQNLKTQKQKRKDQKKEAQEDNNIVAEDAQQRNKAHDKRKEEDKNLNDQNKKLQDDDQAQADQLADENKQKKDKEEETIDRQAVHAFHQGLSSIATSGGNFGAADWAWNTKMDQTDEESAKNNMQLDDDSIRQSQDLQRQMAQNAADLQKQNARTAAEIAANK
ncbi:MAG: hypothetical protein C5B47_00915 [Verrucomicrobia bacterium]|nr:MAG: hypothetical protein C5B47_00915 [Verrucomicrobiota bacterium]